MVQHLAGISMNRGEKTAEYPPELKKLAAIATDLEVAADLRLKAIELIGNMGTHEALQVLLALAGNSKLARKERQLAIKHAGEIIKSER